MLTGIEIDKSLPTPAYLQLKEQLAKAIDGGLVNHGSALPSERDLALSLGLSRMTVRRAFKELVAAGLLEQQQGSGTYVRGQPLEQIIDRVLSFTDEAQHLGFTPGARVLVAEEVSADEQVAAALRLKPGAAVFRLTRLRTAHGEPLALQDAHLVATAAELDIAALTAGASLYGCLERKFGIRPVRARQTIAARLPTRAECAALHVLRDAPVLSLERITFDEADQPFEYTRSAYRGDRYRLALDLRAI